jgi:hypothetical protein
MKLGSPVLSDLRNISDLLVSSVTVPGMRRLHTHGDLDGDRRHAVFAARECGVWNVAAVRDGQVIQPDGPVDAQQAADLVASVLPELAESARGTAPRRRLDRVSRYCPLGGRCESCASAGPALAVVVVPVLSERMCLTLCPTCAASGRPPAIMLSTAEKFVAQHADHLACGGERRVIRTRTGELPA